YPSSQLFRYQPLFRLYSSHCPLRFLVGSLIPIYIFMSWDPSEGCPYMWVALLHLSIGFVECVSQVLTSCRVSLCYRQQCLLAIGLECHWARDSPSCPQILHSKYHAYRLPIIHFVLLQTAHVFANCRHYPPISEHHCSRSYLPSYS